jgi:hypothetical protein
MYALTAIGRTVAVHGPQNSWIREQGPRLAAAKHPSVDAHDRLMARVASEQDDVLCTLGLVEREPELSDRLWDQLVDLLVESVFLDLRRDFLDGRVGREEYVELLTELADRCRHVGLLPLPARGA